MNQAIANKQSQAKKADAKIERKKRVQAREDKSRNNKSRNNKRQARTKVILAAAAIREPNDIKKITFKQAIASLEAAEWMAAINREVNLIKKRKTFSCPLRRSNLPTSLKDREIVTAKLVFNNKTDDLNRILSQKARLVARGFT